VRAYPPLEASRIIDCPAAVAVWTAVARTTAFAAGIWHRVFGNECVSAGRRTAEGKRQLNPGSAPEASLKQRLEARKAGEVISHQSSVLSKTMDRELRTDH